MKKQCKEKEVGMVSEPQLALNQETKIVLSMKNITEER